MEMRMRDFGVFSAPWLCLHLLDSKPLSKKFLELLMFKDLFESALAQTNYNLTKYRPTLCQLMLFYSIWEAWI